MYICVCSGIDESAIKKFLQNNPNELEWEEFLSKYKISKDCGTCLPSLEELKKKYCKFAKDLKT